MAPAVASLVSGLALLTGTIRPGVYSADELTVLPSGAPGGSRDSHRVIGAITADVTARSRDGPLLTDRCPSSCLARLVQHTTSTPDEDGCKSEAKRAHGSP